MDRIIELELSIASHSEAIRNYINEIHGKYESLRRSKVLEEDRQNVVEYQPTD
ncbi:MAG: hypothetical protein ABIH49_00830 [archaeon]